MRIITLAAALLLGSFLSGIAAPGPNAVPNQITEEEKAGGWKLLFDGMSLEGWRSFKKKTPPAHGWEVQEGWLHCMGKDGGDIISDSDFDDFILEWDWKIAPGGNSGLKYFVTEKRESALGHEYQMLDDKLNEDANVGKGKHVTASFYDVLKPERPPPTNPVGEINHSKVVIKGNHVEHWLNGAKVLEYACGSEAMKDAVGQSKFKNTQGFGDKIRGHILLQDHHSEAWFRNLKIRAGE